MSKEISKKFKAKSSILALLSVMALLPTKSISMQQPDSDSTISGLFTRVEEVPEPISVPAQTGAPLIYLQNMKSAFTQLQQRNDAAARTAISRMQKNDPPAMRIALENYNSLLKQYIDYDRREKDKQRAMSSSAQSAAKEVGRVADQSFGEVEEALNRLAASVDISRSFSTIREKFKENLERTSERYDQEEMRLDNNRMLMDIRDLQREVNQGIPEDIFEATRDYIGRGNNRVALIEFLRNPEGYMRGERRQEQPSNEEAVLRARIAELERQAAMLEAQSRGQMDPTAAEKVEEIKEALIDFAARIEQLVATAEQEELALRSQGAPGPENDRQRGNRERIRDGKIANIWAKLGDKIKADLRQEFTRLLSEADESKLVAQGVMVELMEGGRSPEVAGSKPLLMIYQAFNDFFGESMQQNIRSVRTEYAQKIKRAEVNAYLDTLKEKYEAAFARGKDWILQEATNRSPLLNLLVLEPKKDIEGVFGPKPYIDFLKAYRDYATVDDLEVLLYHFGQKNTFEKEGVWKNTYDFIEEYMRDKDGGQNPKNLPQPVIGANVPALGTALRRNDLENVRFKAAAVQGGQGAQALQDFDPDINQLIILQDNPAKSKFTQGIRDEMRGWLGKRDANIETALDALKRYLDPNTAAGIAEVSAWNQFLRAKRAVQ